MAERDSQVSVACWNAAQHVTTVQPRPVRDTPLNTTPYCSRLRTVTVIDYYRPPAHSSPRTLQITTQSQVYILHHVRSYSVSRVRRVSMSWDPSCSSYGPIFEMYRLEEIPANYINVGSNLQLCASRNRQKTSVK